jgi:predicted metal-binding membrane protein
MSMFADLFNVANWRRLRSMADDFRHLDAGGRLTARLAGETTRVVFGAVWAAVVIAWLVLASMAASLPPDSIGPGADLIGALPFPEIGGFAAAFARLCLSPATSDAGLPAYAALAAMWFTMAIAMMLPSAAPMIRTYCEIADTAAQSGKRVVHPVVLIAGYLAVWLLAALAFAGATIAIQSIAADRDPLAGWTGAAVLAVAGLWQFSSLKDACLTKCRTPFATLFGGWTDRPAGIFRLGAEQGVWCIGCCWALMLVMFAVGIMNLFWMALIGVFAVVEKGENGRAISRAAGTILLVWAAALLVVSA